MPITTVAESYIPLSGVQCTFGGVGGAFMSGGISLEFETDEMTNNGGFGAYEDVPTVRKATFSNAVIAIKGTATGLKSGSIYALLVNCATMPTTTAGVMADPTPVVAGAPSFAGNMRIKLEGVPMLDVKAGAKIPVSGTSQGLFSYTV